MTAQAKTIVIGAGIGGLATALRLAHAGLSVTVLERHGHPGGKIRALPSAAGPVDGGPTVLTLRPVFEALFADVGERLSDHVRMTPLTTLARHFWSDGRQLDLSADPDISAQNIAQSFSRKAARDFRAFSRRTERLFDAFDAPMMRAPEPSQSALTRHVMRHPSLIPAMAPHQSLAKMLSRRFRDPQLAQLFGRYATYVGGSPYHAPALLSLIYQAEASGVWHLPDGLHALAHAIEALAVEKGVTFKYNCDVTAINTAPDGLTIDTRAQRYRADAVVFNGDPRALETGLLGAAVARAVDPQATEPRSLSACVLAFAATVTGPPLSHHNVFFGDDPRAEFDALAAGNLPGDATLYVCAQDRGDTHRISGPERFEIILNAPAGLTLSPQEHCACLTQIFQRLAQFGLQFDPMPQPGAMTTPQDFDTLFPASQGALYGRSPHGLTAAFKRPTARSRIPRLYLVGGGAHPGAGVPMATLSAQHAVAAILKDLPLISTSAPTATHGGMSTVSAIAGRGRSRSSGS